jgi:L-fucose isomerase-like protein
MMKQRIKLGIVCFTRNTFDDQAAQALYKNILNDLQALENAEIVAMEQPVSERPEALEAGRLFASQNVDAFAAVSGTFHLGHLLLDIKKQCDRPVLLWGLPELPYNGGKIRLNSVCGVNLNASNLVKSGIHDFTYHIGDTIDQSFVDAVRMIAALREARVGIIGYRAHGFFNVGVDELSLYGKFNTLIDHYELSELIGYEADKNEIEGFSQKASAQFHTAALSDGALKKVGELAAKIKRFMDDKQLAALAIRCWPEFADAYGIAPCASMSLLQSGGYITACEGDIDCALTMICHRAAGAQTPFMADLSQANIEQDSALMWHCGVAPCNLKDETCDCTLDGYHAGGRGVTAGFVMKQGTFSAARLDSAAGQYRLFLEKGETLPMEKLLTGTYAKVRFSHPIKDVLDTLIYSGVAHHVSMVYGDFSDVFRIFARLAGLEVLS